jgi:hypothetical protein
MRARFAVLRRVFLYSNLGREVIAMVCQTIKTGTECIFMTKKGCTYNGGKCHPVVEQCQGCERIVEYPTGHYCNSYSEPRLKWLNSSCNFATHIKRAQINNDAKKLNPLKASKRNNARS